MCVIAVKLADVKPLSDEVITQCWESNPHGAGISITNRETGMVKYEKGFLRLNQFINYCHKNVGENDIAVYHFRLATSGGINKRMCHPFQISEIAGMDGVIKLSDESDKMELLFHNGVIGKGSKNLSDTALFALHLQRRTEWKDKNRLIKLMSDVNKFVVVTPKWIRLYGSWTKDKDTNAIFSNMSYKYKLWLLDDSGNIVQPSCPKCNGEKITTISMTDESELFECDSCGALFNGNRMLISEPEQYFEV